MGAIVILLCLFASVPAAHALGEASILIVTGEDYAGHHWRETTPILRSYLEQDPRLRVEVLDDLKRFATTDFSRYGAIVLHFKNYDPNLPGRAGYDALSRYVREGGGLVLVHFASGAFQEFKEQYVFLAGRVWDAKRGHDPYGRFTVRFTNQKHPITAGLRDFQTTDELYTCLVGQTPLDTLAVATSVMDGREYPMAMALTFGKGRVFHSPLGHDVRALSVSEVGRLFRRATVWAARLELQTGGTQ